MDDIINAPLWQKITAVILIVAVAIWGYYSYLYRPKAVKIANLKSQLKSVEMELKLITPPGTVLKDGDDAREMVRKELEEMMKKIPTEAEVVYIINDLITRVGRGLNIDLGLIKPEPVAAEHNYRRLPLNVTFKSDYTDLNFYLRDLKKLPTTVRIDKLDLGRTPDASKLDVRMLMSAFVMPGTGKTREEVFRAERAPSLFDPFYKLDTEKKEDKKIEQKGFVLQGIWYGANVKAFINDRSLGVGDMIDGFTVAAITKDRVTLKRDIQTIILKLEE